MPPVADAATFPSAMKTIFLRIAFALALAGLGGILPASSATTDPVPTDAVLQWLQPADGSTVSGAAPVTLGVRAIDPHGAILRLEFFADGNSLGVSELVFIRPPVPGEPIDHTFLWKSATPGKHLLHATGVDAAGVVVTTPRIVVVVTDAGARNVVTIAALDPEASETPDASGALRPARFRIQRQGAVDFELPVSYETGGTAVNGVDYAKLPGHLVIPKGADFADLLVEPIPDPLAEEKETVILTIVPPICPAIFPPPRECYEVGVPAKAVATIVDATLPANHTPEVKITSPADGATFDAPAAITLVASAADADGVFDLLKVEFYDGDIWLGEGRGVVPNPHWDGERVLIWKEPAAGPHRLTAKVTDRAGATGVSPVILIQVNRGTGLPVVTVEATDAEAKEPSWQHPMANLGQFTLKRTGDLSGALRVRYTLGGTASNGLDYVLLPGVAGFLPGAASTQIDVLPLPDRQAEGAEKVILTVQATDAYAVGKPAEAVVTIQDASAVDPQVATLTLDAPTNHTVLPEGSDVAMSATAIDPAGYISQVDFYAGEQLLGTSRIDFIVAPPAGTPIHHEFVWKHAAAGRYLLTVRAHDAGGKPVESAPVALAITAQPEEGFVTRALPATYAPGRAFTVSLLAQPRAGTSTYVVQDVPPAGWEVSAVDQEGGFDPVTQSVKFGPFFDAGERTLTYTVTPPADTKGPGLFEGKASADGHGSAIGGDRLVQPAPHGHPADLAAADGRIDLNELSAYGAAWKTGASWPADPNPIPAEYVTRAGYLWRQGEVYHYDAKAGAPPLCWVPGPAVGLATDDDGTGHTEPRAGVAQRRTTIDSATGSLRVVIAVEPAAGQSAYAIEERIPEGWKADAASPGGQTDPARQVVRWGPFLDGQARELSYALLPGPTPREARFVGIAAFDGQAVRILGPGVVRWPESAPGPFAGAVRLDAGRLLIGLPVTRGTIHAIEASTDLVHWFPVATGEAVDGMVTFVDDRQMAGPARFYRAKALE